MNRGHFSLYVTFVTHLRKKPDNAVIAFRSATNPPSEGAGSRDYMSSLETTPYFLRKINGIVFAWEIVIKIFETRDILWYDWAISNLIGWKNVIMCGVHVYVSSLWSLLMYKWSSLKDPLILV